MNEEKRREVEDILRDSGVLDCDIITTSFNEDEIKNLEMHKYNLLSSDAVLILYEKTNDRWINTKLKDLLKIPGYGRNKPFLAKGIITNVDLPKLDEIFYKDLLILNINGTIDQKILKPFIDKVNNKWVSKLP